ncbi:hypothetical protein Tco_0732560, partial [Tanacetum coccineum]
GNPEEELKDHAIIDSGCSGTTFKGRIACKVWTLKEDLMLFLRGGVHTLELEDGTMIHMLAERRYPLSRELMIRMLDHGMEDTSVHFVDN